MTKRPKDFPTITIVGIIFCRTKKTVELKGLQDLKECRSNYTVGIKEL